MGLQNQASGFPKPTGEKRLQALAILTSNLLWPENWAICILQGTGQEEKGCKTQKRLKSGSRQNFLPELSEFQTTPHRGFRRGPFCTTAGGGGSRLRASPHRGDWERERTAQLFSHVWPCFPHTAETAFVRSLGNLCAITALGGGRSGGSCTRTGGGGGERLGQGSFVRPGLVLGPHPVLSQLGHLRALTKHNPAPLRPRASQRGGKRGAHSLPPALVLALGLSSPNSAVRV